VSPIRAAIRGRTAVLKDVFLSAIALSALWVIVGTVTQYNSDSV
jgi:hypothetical protein